MLVKEVSLLYPRGISKACHLLGTSRSSLGYRSVKNDLFLEQALSGLSSDHPREGFWKAYFRLRNRGYGVNHKRLHRVYKQMGLPLRRKAKKRLPLRVKEPIVIPETFARCWSIDFVSDVLSNGRKFRSFNVIDDYNREVFAFPGSIHQMQSEGCHALIKNQQAHLLTSADDLLQTMNWTNPQQERTIQDQLELSSIQKEILAQFKTKNSWTIDELAECTNQPVAHISSALFELELKGALENKGANRYLLPL